MTRVPILLSRLWGRVRARHGDRDMDAEIASHLAEAADDYMRQGLSREDARLAALRGFGSVARTREIHRDLRSFMWLDDFGRDVRHAVRTLLATPAFTFVAIVTLALGIGANTTIFTLLDAVILKPLPVPAARELVTFYENGPEGTADPTGGTGRYLRFSYPRFERLAQALGPRGSLAAVTRSVRFAARVPGSGGTRLLQAQLVSGNYFTTLGVGAARGRVLTPDDVRRDRASAVAVISDGFWKRVLGAADAAIGETLVINGVSATVVGVTPPGFFGLWTDSEAEVWLPLTLQPALRYQTNWSSYARVDAEQPWHAQDAVSWLNLVARIPSADLPRVVPALQGANHQGLMDLASLVDAKSRPSMLAHTLAIEPFSHGFSGLRARFSDALFALTALVALVLVVTCANIATLLLARAAGRARDIAIRLSLGATTGRLVRQGLTESLMLATAGGAAGVLLGEWASGLLAREALGTSGQLPTVFSPDARVLAFAIGVSLITAIVFGVAPALRALAVGRSVALGANQRHGAGQVATRGMRSLVVGQLALAVVVVFAAILLGRTLINFLRIDPGFSTDRLVTASFDPAISHYPADQMPALARRLVLAARTVPGVVSAAAARCGLIAGCSSSRGYRIDAAHEGVTLYQNWVSPGYFATTGIPLVDGREFDERDTAAGAPVAIVNESIVRRYFPGERAIGRRIGSGRIEMEIVGVVRDAHTQSLHDAPVPMVYFPIEQEPAELSSALTNLDVRVAPHAPGLVLPVREAIRQSEPDLLLGSVDAMSARLARDLNRERIVAALALGFGAIALLLASLGLYGVLSYGVARRTQEIGVRMALGAQRLEVMGFVLGQSVRLTIAGLILGLIGTAFLARYLARLLFGVTPLDPITFIAVTLTLVLVTTVASYVPARRATKVDPLVALRAE